jgi:hypothetical protein
MIQMFKKFFTILCCLGVFVQANAQTQSIEEEGRMYDDRPLKKVQTDELDMDYETVEEEETVKKYKDFGKEVQGDTLIEFNNFELSKDSINAWKNNKKYAWIKTIENDLKENVEETDYTEGGEGRAGKNNKKIGQSKEEEEEVRTGRKNRGNTGFSAADGLFNSGIFKMILWVLAGLFICFVVYNLFLSGGKFGKNTKEVKATIIEEEVDENDMDNDFASLQRKAYNAGDTRLAMRYMFLKMLQSLQQKGHIQFVPDKTNAVYAMELPDGYKNDFSSLAMYFEYVWYGKLDIEKEVFDKIENKYNQFLNRI